MKKTSTTQTWQEIFIFILIYFNVINKKYIIEKTYKLMKGGNIMIFIIVPDYPEILSWKSIFNLAKKRIFKSYGNRFNIYKIYTKKDEEREIFRKVNFIATETYDLKIKSEFNQIFSNQKELDKILENFLLELDEENSVCLIDKSFYPTVSRFMESSIRVEFFKVVQDNTYFQLINTSIVPLKDLGTESKEEKKHEIGFIHTIK